MSKITKDSNFNGHPLSTTYQNDQGFRTVILDKIWGLLDYMTKHHGKVFFTMFELNYPANSLGMYPEDNDAISKFSEALMRHYGQDRRGYDPKYLWVRERSSSNQYHYHMIVLLDGNKCRNAHGIHEKAIELWGLRLGRDANGLVQLCRSHVHDNGYGGVQLIRNSPDYQQVFDHCFQCGSYFAKAYSKGFSAAYVNEYGCSRLPCLGQ